VGEYKYSSEGRGSQSSWPYETTERQQTREERQQILDGGVSSSGEAGKGVNRNGCGRRPFPTDRQGVKVAAGRVGGILCSSSLGNLGVTHTPGRWPADHSSRGMEARRYLFVGGGMVREWVMRNGVRPRTQLLGTIGAAGGCGQPVLWTGRGAAKRLNRKMPFDGKIQGWPREERA